MALVDSCFHTVGLNTKTTWGTYELINYLHTKSPPSKSALAQPSTSVRNLIDIFTQRVTKSQSNRSIYKVYVWSIHIHIKYMYGSLWRNTSGGSKFVRGCKLSWSRYFSSITISSLSRLTRSSIAPLSTPNLCRARSRLVKNYSDRSCLYSICHLFILHWQKLEYVIILMLLNQDLGHLFSIW